jgi:SAM-dependent methyltransferase
MPKKRRRIVSLDKKKARTGWLFVLPFAIGFAIIYLPIIIDSITYSFCQITYVKNGFELDFVGFANYRNALLENTDFVRNLMGGIKQLLFDIPAIVIFSLFMAVLLNKKMFGRAAFRAIFFIPVILSTGLISTIDAANILNDYQQNGSIDTGGGEFLLTLNHPFENTAAMENYAPNVTLCKEVLLPLGIDFRSGDGKEKLPFDDGSFDMVINRHGDFNAEEICRVLKPGGLFITQQVGAENDRELVALLCGESEMPFPEQYLELTSRKFQNAGFTILRGEEVHRPIRFFDVGALVWFARIIQWEFPNFSVDAHLENLLNAQRILDERGSIDGSIHRFLLVAQK